MLNIKQKDLPYNKTRNHVKRKKPTKKRQKEARQKPDGKARGQKGRAG